MLRRLHDSEINAGLQTFFDAGPARLYRRSAHGREALAKIGKDDVAWSTEGSIARWLREAAMSLFPDSDEAHELAAAADKTGLVNFEHGGSVSLTEKGRQRGATFKPPS